MLRTTQVTHIKPLNNTHSMIYTTFMPTRVKNEKIKLLDIRVGDFIEIEMDTCQIERVLVEKRGQNT